MRPHGLATGGKAIARDGSGRLVFVDGVFPGDVVDAVVTGGARKPGTARDVRLIETGPRRIDAPCPEFARGCGGCQWQDIALETQLVFKRDMVHDALSDALHRDVPEPRAVVSLPEWRFRTTIRAGVVGGWAGLRRLRSHEILAVNDCLVAHPLLVELLTEGRYDGAREVLLRCGARTGERLVSTTPGKVRPKVPADVRFDWIHEQAAGRTWRVSAGSFFQSRPDGVDALAEIVSEAAAALRTGTAIDLYAGVGVFGGVLAEQGWSVTAVESSASAVKDASLNLGQLGVSVVRSEVEAWDASPADLVVADPSRTGLDASGVATVLSTGAQRVILVSCDPLSMRRDARLLASEGYELTEWSLVDLFPHTFHVEVVTVYDRVSLR